MFSDSEVLLNDTASCYKRQSGSCPAYMRKARDGTICMHLSLRSANVFGTIDCK
jgi:hypothetical protein